MFDLPSYLMGSGSGGGGGGGSSTLVGLTDVDISNPTDGQTLVYNATSQKWENGEGGGGGDSPTKSLATISGTEIATPDAHGEYQIYIASTVQEDDYPAFVACKNVTVTVGDIITTIPYVAGDDYPVNTPSNIENGSITRMPNNDGLWSLRFEAVGPGDTEITVSVVGELYTLSDDLYALFG